MRGMKLLHILHDHTSVSPLKSVVSLSDTDREQLRHLLAAGMASTRTLTHARILLKADAAPAGPGWTDARVSDALDVSPTTVLRVRQAWAWSGLDDAVHRAPTTRQYRRALNGRQRAGSFSV